MHANTNAISDPQIQAISRKFNQVHLFVQFLFFFLFVQVNLKKDRILQL